MARGPQKQSLFVVPKRILIADDHLAVREGLRSLIDPDPEFEVIAEAADGNEAAQKALELHPDLIVLDNSMPGMTGLEVARMLRANLPQTKIVFLTLDPGIKDLAIATGAVAHVSKDMLLGTDLKIVTSTLGEVRDTLRNAHAAGAVPLASVPLPAQRPQRRIAPRPLVLAGAIAASLLLVVGSLSFVLTQSAAVQARANLTIFEGSVAVRHGSGTFAPAHTNDVVQQGDAIRTDTAAHAALTLFDHSVVVLDPDTEVELVTLRSVSNGQDIDVTMKQSTGSTWHVVAHAIGSAGHYEVATPTATSTVRGTAFRVSLDSLSNTTVKT